MPSVETICSRQWRDPDFRQKWLVGGLIASIPLLNILVLGYVLRYVRSLRAGGNLELPEWNDWRSLLVDGLHMLALGLLYVGLPTLIGALVSTVMAAVFHFLRLHLFAATLAVLPLTVGLLAGSLLSLGAVQHFLRREDWQDMLNWQRTLRITNRMLPSLLFPMLAFWGLMVLGWPLLGLTLFLGLMPLFAYATAVYLDEAGASTF